MNIPIWLLLIAPPVFAMIGFLTCAVLTAGKVDDAQAEEYTGPYINEAPWQKLADARAAHARVTDALAAKNARIQTLTDIARSQQSIKSGRIIDVLEG